MLKRFFGGVCCLLLGGITLGTTAAQEKKNENLTATNEKDAGPDFALQGEYVGTIELADGEKHKLGAQVIALGNGKFRTKFHIGGLPGDGWDGKMVRLADAETKGSKTVYLGKSTDPSGEAPDKEFSGSIDGKTISLTVDGITSTLNRETRISPTLGAKAPAGAIVLFDGTNANEWKDGKLIEGNLLNNGIYSKRQFKDFKAHLEFRLPFMPNARGQGRANSGLYPQGHNYEVQILDSFGLDGKDNECGGLYTVRAPDVNMCLPPLAWQTYDIDFKQARFDASGKKTADAVITVKLNGVTVQDNVSIPMCTEDHNRKIENKPGPIHLQNHGNPVYFKNIWVVETK